LPLPSPRNQVLRLREAVVEPGWLCPLGHESNIRPPHAAGIRRPLLDEARPTPARAGTGGPAVGRNDTGVGQCSGMTPERAAAWAPCRVVGP
jgi:hypothetical protein